MPRRVAVLSAMLSLFVSSVAFAQGGLTLNSAKDVGPNKKDEAKAASFSLPKAVAFMDEAAAHWTKARGCFACHTNYAYLYARPHVTAAAPKSYGEVREALEEMVVKRWPDKGPRWDAEVVSTAAALAYHDGHTTGKLHPTTRTALDRIWKVQQKDGGFSWLKCDWPPMENDDHYGATLALIAVGSAPEGYAKTDAAAKGVARIREYLAKNGPQNVHHKLMLLWASATVDNIVTPEQKSAYIDEIRKLQKADGGWASGSFGNWRRADKTEQDRDTSDGYGAGFTIFVLRKVGVPANDPAIQKGVAWLKANQRESGRWYTRSLFRDAPATKHYLTHVGTAFAIMAIAECETKTKAPVVGSR